MILISKFVVFRKNLFQLHLAVESYLGVHGNVFSIILKMGLGMRVSAVQLLVGVLHSAVFVLCRAC